MSDLSKNLYRWCDPSDIDYNLSQESAAEIERLEAILESLPYRLRLRCRDEADCVLLGDAADEIERLQAVINQT